MARQLITVKRPIKTVPATAEPLMRSY